jgi:hypothetical protein
MISYSAATLTIGFTVAYFVAFHVRSTAMQTVLFLICTIPFIRITFEVQNGMVQMRKSTVCIAVERTWKATK